MKDQEYGAQDFFGSIDELRVWRTARSQDQIKEAGRRPSHAWHMHHETACALLMFNQ